MATVGGIKADLPSQTCRVPLISRRVCGHWQQHWAAGTLWWSSQTPCRSVALGGRCWSWSGSLQTGGPIQEQLLGHPHPHPHSQVDISPSDFYPLKKTKITTRKQRNFKTFFHCWKFFIAKSNIPMLQIDILPFRCPKAKRFGFLGCHLNWHTHELNPDASLNVWSFCSVW